MSTHKIYLVEDDADTNHHLSELIKQSNSLNFVGSARSFNAALKYLKSNIVDCLVTDICLPDGSGLNLIKWCNENQPNTHCLVISVLGDEQALLQAIAAGADGYLLKDSDEDRLSSAVNEILQGGAPISAFMAKYMLGKMPKYNLAQARDSIEPNTPGLTQKETEVLKIIARGYSYKETAAQLEISPNTIPNHIKNIYRKLQVHSRGEAVYQAMRLGIIDEL